MKTIQRTYPGPPPFNYTANQVGTTHNGVEVEIDVHLEGLGAVAALSALKLIGTYQERLSNLFSWWPMPTTCSVMRAHGSGAEHFGRDSTIFIGQPPITDRNTLGTVAHQIAALWVCEAVEFYALAGQKDWTSSFSHGEALSRFIGDSFVPNGLVAAGIQSVAFWLNASGRPDWVSKSAASETETVPIGCGVAFLHYLHDVCKLALPDIVAASGNSLEEKYRKLTGKHGGYHNMRAVIDKKFPPGKPVPNILPMDSPFLFR